MERRSPLWSRRRRNPACRRDRAAKGGDLISPCSQTRALSSSTGSIYVRNDIGQLRSSRAAHHGRRAPRENGRSSSSGLSCRHPVPLYRESRKSSPWRRPPRRADSTPDVREKGRSAVLRQLVSDFLRQRREREIDAQYERAYKEDDSPLGEEFAGWEDESLHEQIRQIEEGLGEADAGDFASAEEVAAVFARWTETPVIPSSGNVFADLGFAEPEEELTKAQLASHIQRIIRRRRLTQVAAAALMGIDQPKVAALLNGRLASFSTDRLLRLLTVLGQDVEIVVKEKASNLKKDGSR